MIKSINHIALIVSGDETLDFYRKLCFVETSRTPRPEKNDILIMMENGQVVLEVFQRSDAPARHFSPEAYGLRYLALNVDDVDEILAILKDYDCQQIRVDGNGRRFVFVNDPEGQPVEFLEA